MNRTGSSRLVGLALTIVLGVCFACDGRILYVDGTATGTNDGSSWANAHKHLQDALAAAKAADKPIEIRVAYGIYKPDQGGGITPGDQGATFQLLNGVTLNGGYAGAPDPNARDVELYETTLSGDLRGNDISRDNPDRLFGRVEVSRAENSRHVATGSGTDPTAVIDGFTITAGYALPNPFDRVSSGSGAGILIDAGSPTILHCRFTDNTGWMSRAALLARNASCPYLADCSFVNNDGTGMCNVVASHSVLSNCRFVGNTAGAIYSDRSSPAITGCMFMGNQGPAMEGSDCNSVLTNCVFEADGTVETESGISGARSNLVLEGCTFRGLAGGCIDISNGHLSLSCCTFTGNSGAPSGAVHCVDSLAARECTFTGNSGSTVGAISGGYMELENCEFTGNSGAGAGAIDAQGNALIATGCLFSGNSGLQGGGAISIHSTVLLCSNCTFAGNRGLSNSIEHPSTGGAWHAELGQCVVWDGPHPFSRWPAKPFQVSVTYSDVQDGYPGEGNINVDPCFVDPGYWTDPSDPIRQVDPQDPCAIWIAGDYHLQSQGGHWNRATGIWARDQVTSACIDAGDPNAPVGDEPFPNGGSINMGAYGGTVEASKSYFGEPVCETQITDDINGDCKVDQRDADILALPRLLSGPKLPNIPPTVTMIGPEDGAELTYPAPLVLEAAAADPDGRILWVGYTMDYRTESIRSGSGMIRHNPAEEGWAVTWDWSLVRYDGKYTIWATVVDNMGAKTVSPKITVTLHPAK